MPVSDIADVTRFIINKLETLEEWGDLDVPIFPDAIRSEDGVFGLSFYLYHVQENGSFKNTPSPSRDIPPVKYIPMALNLFYQLTAHRNRDQGEAAFEEQMLMTYAMKFFHDHPVLTLPDTGDQFKITLQPVPSNDAVHNWTAGSMPMKLSAYYEVSPVFIEPDKPRLFANRVLTYGNYVFPSSAPRIVSSQSIIQFQLPNETSLRQVTAQPGQAAPGGNITFKTTGFGDGEIQLLIFNMNWKENVLASEWDLEYTKDQLKVTVKETAILERNNEEIDMLPGMYSAQLVATKTLRLSDGSVKEFRQRSNQFPFIVMPLIEDVSIDDTIVAVEGYGFQQWKLEIELEEGEIQTETMEVYAGEYALVRAPEDSFDRGQFRVPTESTLEINLPEEIVSGQHPPLRVLVAGAEVSPLWLDIP